MSSQPPWNDTARQAIAIFGRAVRDKVIGPGHHGLPYSMFLSRIQFNRGTILLYLFREDFSGVYLSLNQGITEIRQKYESQAKESLQTRAADYRAQLGTMPASFEPGTIDLRPSGTQNLSAYYQAGSICAKFYAPDVMPDDHTLVADFHNILAAYDLLSYNETVPIGSGLHEEDEEATTLLEDLRKFRQHKRIERNANLVKEVKRIQGYTCRLCGFNFETTYGDIGHHFIEAHHLTPISELKGKAVLLDPAIDFTVLCSNCHRMLHRCEAPHDIEGFKGKYL